DEPERYREPGPRGLGPRRAVRARDSALARRALAADRRARRSASFGPHARARADRRRRTGPRARRGTRPAALLPPAGGPPAAARTRVVAAPGRTAAATAACSAPRLGGVARPLARTGPLRPDARPRVAARTAARVVRARRPPRLVGARRPGPAWRALGPAAARLRARALRRGADAREHADPDLLAALPGLRCGSAPAVRAVGARRPGPRRARDDRRAAGDARHVRRHPAPAPVPCPARPAGRAAPVCGLMRCVGGRGSRSRAARACGCWTRARARSPA